jgi:protein-L-isoaspartate(D-aspartate) O-methyltransferase
MNTRTAGVGMTSNRTRMRMVERLRDQGIKDELVLASMSEIPRHVFVDEALAHRAYEDLSLPIGYGQTISNPQTVARMLEILRGGRMLKRVLEIGSGCGYQAALLSRFAKYVWTIERLLPLVSKTRINLRDLNIRNVKAKHGDGHLGLPEEAPFDGIVMAAAASHVPEQLLDQLAVGGRLIMPLGPREQQLTLIERDERGLLRSVLEAVHFVPLVPGLGR